MSLSIDITSDAQQAVALLSPARTLAAVARAMDDENDLTVGHIVKTKLTKAGPEFLNRRDGLLGRSLRRSNAVISADGVSSSIGTNVFYAAIHEYGSEPYDIVAKNGKALSFLGRGGKRVARRKVRHPGHKARRPIGAGVEERLPSYASAISRAIVDALGEGRS